MATAEDGAAYARAVTGGAITACKWVRLAAQRFLDDLERSRRRDFPYRFAPGHAQVVLDWLGLCHHIKGAWAGQPVEPEGWETFILCQIFGWVHKRTGLRRFRTGYIECPRKNGKSTLLAPIGLYMLAADGEAGAEVYSAATKREQAKIVFETARRMVRVSPALRRYINVQRDNLHVDATGGKFEPLGADADTLDGLNSHCNLIDELHAHKSRDVWDVLETGMGARTQPLQLAITTAGFDQEGICKEQHNYTRQVLERVIEDETYFGIIYTVDDEDLIDAEGKPDPTRVLTDEAIWRKANPNWGVSVQPDDIRRLAAKAAQVPAAQNNFLCKRLNVWVQQAVRWLDVALWNRSGKPFDAADLKGRACYGGLDLSTKIDVTAFVLVFPPHEGRDDWIVLPRFFIPEETMRERSQRDKVPYDQWAKQGFMEATEGNIIDYGTVRERIEEDAESFGIQEIAYDPWNATDTALQLQAEGLVMVETRQGYKSMSAPSKELEALVRAGKLSHNGHPVLRWNASNVSLRTDGNENYIPDKKTSSERIDGIVALIMALGRAMVHQAEPEKKYQMLII